MQARCLLLAASAALLLACDGVHLIADLGPADGGEGGAQSGKVQTGAGTSAGAGAENADVGSGETAAGGAGPGTAGQGPGGEDALGGGGSEATDCEPARSFDGELTVHRQSELELLRGVSVLNGYLVISGDVTFPRWSAS